VEIVNHPLFHHIDMGIHEPAIDIELSPVLEQVTLQIQRILTIAGGKDKCQTLCGRMNANQVTLWLMLGLWTWHYHIGLKATFEQQQRQGSIITTELIDQRIQADITDYVTAHNQKVGFDSKKKSIKQFMGVMILKLLETHLSYI